MTCLDGSRSKLMRLLPRCANPIQAASSAKSGTRLRTAERLVDDLDGATKLKLDGVLHSSNEAGTTMPTDRWYGSERVVDRWLPAAIERNA